MDEYRNEGDAHRELRMDGRLDDEWSPPAEVPLGFDDLANIRNNNRHFYSIPAYPVDRREVRATSHHPAANRRKIVLLQVVLHIQSEEVDYCARKNPLIVPLGFVHVDKESKHIDLLVGTRVRAVIARLHARRSEGERAQQIVVQSQEQSLPQLRFRLELDPLFELVCSGLVQELRLHFVSTAILHFFQTIWAFLWLVRFYYLSLFLVRFYYLFEIELFDFLLESSLCGLENMSVHTLQAVDNTQVQDGVAADISPEDLRVESSGSSCQFIHWKIVVQGRGKGKHQVEYLDVVRADGELQRISSIVKFSFRVEELPDRIRLQERRESPGNTVKFISHRTSS